MLVSVQLKYDLISQGPLNCYSMHVLRVYSPILWVSIIVFEKSYPFGIYYVGYVPMYVKETL